MVDGLWTVLYFGPHGEGGGVVVLNKGRVLGGDSGFFYEGSYEVIDGVFRGRVSVKNFVNTVPNVIGIVGDFDLLMDVKIEGNSMKGTGALATAPDAKIAVLLTKRTNLS
jgi:hypothetical protein